MDGWGFDNARLVSVRPENPNEMVQAIETSCTPLSPLKPPQLPFKWWRSSREGEGP